LILHLYYYIFGINAKYPLKPKNILYKIIWFFSILVELNVMQT